MRYLQGCVFHKIEEICSKVAINDLPFPFIHIDPLINCMALQKWVENISDLVE